MRLLGAAAVWAALVPAAGGQEAGSPAKTPTPGTAAASTPAPRATEEGPRLTAPSLGRLVATPAAEPNDPMFDLESRSPPDGKWLKTDEGREYFVTRLKKVPGTYQRLPNRKNVAYKKIYRWEYDREDDEYFYVRVYRGAGSEPSFDPDAAKKAEAEKLRVEESYRVELAHVDRLSFSSYDTGLPREGQWRQGFDVADMNGDGHLDIVHGSPRKQIFTPVIFLGDGAGGWRYWSDVTWPAVEFDYGDAAATDFDGDGRLDLALGIHLRGIKALLQTSPGHFVDASEGLQFEVPGRGGDASAFASRAIEIADWNDDGKPDLIALGEGARQSSTASNLARGLPFSSSYGVVIYLNQGGGSWNALSQGASSGVFGDSFAFGHLDGDDRLDLVSASNTLGDRGLLFLNSSEEEKGYHQLELGSVPLKALTYSVATGDFDEDGRDDIVTSFGTTELDVPRSGLTLHTRDAEGNWHSRLWYVDAAVEAAWALNSGDLDGDGHLDVVAISHLGKVTVLLGDGKGGVSLEDSPELDPPGACRGYGVRLADVNRDGKPEILATFAGEAGDFSKLLDQATCDREGAIRVWRADPLTKANS
jgi:hypothetical protein